MEKYKYLIIGGGMAGTTAAETIRENDKEGSVAIISQEKYPLYSKVVLPMYLGGSVPEEKVFLRSEISFKEKNISLLLRANVVKIDPDDKKVFLENGDELSFEKLLIASGGSSRKMEVEAADRSNIFYFQSFDEARRLKEKMLISKGAVIVGGGFNALEIAEAFSKNSIKTSILLRGENLLGGSFDKESNEIIRKNIKEKGISLFSNEQIKKIDKEMKNDVLVSQKDNRYPFDILVMSIGVKRNLDFLIDSGIKTESGVVTDEFLKTNKEDIFAAGDISEFYDIILDKRMLLRNWTSAFLQGKTAGLNMVGKKEAFRHVSGYNVVNFGINISFLGDVSKDENTVLVSRGDTEKKERTQLFLRNNILVGATQINMNKEKGVLAKLIEQKIDLTEFLDKLGDDDFEIKSIIN